VAHPPSVDKLARSLAETGLPHPLLVAISRAAIAGAGPNDGAVEIEAAAHKLAQRRTRSMLQPVINATGVLLHTNLGRAPLAVETSADYLNLEHDLISGKRGSRQAAVGELVAAASGAEAAIVVNNCAGAVLLTLAALAAGNGVTVGRGDLVEIGGGFRIPDVMNQSGARLIEVGTTNRTRLADYSTAAETNDVALSMSVHRSNYRITGFTEDTSVAELASLDAPVVADIGSGLLDAACPWLDGPPPSWLDGEPAARQTLADGAALVLFSGDKLLGGPQAGIIAGRADLVSKCAKHPLARALRPGSLVLNAMQEVTLAYLRRDGASIPFWNMATASVDSLTQRASRISESIGDERLRVSETEATPGGGTLPGVAIPSAGLKLGGDVTKPLRDQPIPIIARVENSQTFLDLRTVHSDRDDLIAEGLRAALGLDL
jgi:L-seryl-tRNA(Ser) seleniumtransferase